MKVEGGRSSNLKQINQALDRSEALMHAVFEAAVDGILTINNRGEILSINSAGAVLFGYEVDELIGKKVNVLMPNPHQQEHDSYIERYERTHEARIIGIGRQVEGLKKDGTTFPFKLSVSEVKSQPVPIYTGIIHDMSAQFEVEAQLKNLNEQLETIVEDRTIALNAAIDKLSEINNSLHAEVGLRQKAEAELKGLLAKERELNELKSRFVSMASHEFRTPLGAVLSSASLIGRYENIEDQENRLKHVNRIRTAVGHLTNILDEFLSLDKLQTGKVKPDSREFDAVECVDDVIDEFSGLCKKGQFIEHLHDTESIPVFQDRGILKNILLNLLSNAMKYSDEGSRITVTTRRDKNWMSISVADEGIGIPEKNLKHMFERFFRASNAVNIKGTGLGLNIVRRYLDIVGGRIDMKSKENEGSIFTTQIPVRTDLLK